MADTEGQGEAMGLTRRELIKRAAIVGGVAVWAAPVIRMAIGSGGGGGQATQNLVGARLAAFDAPCSPINLDDPSTSTTRTVCAANLSKASSAFKSQVTTECTAKCKTLGPCDPADACLTTKRGGTTIGTITCTGPGPDCPVPPYARNTKEFVCTAVVTCNCVCR